jgi:chorismate mutase/prephenate dehydratase
VVLAKKRRKTGAGDERPARAGGRGRRAPEPGRSKGAESDPLAPLRNRITELDAKIVALLNERAGAVVEVGKVKRAKGLPVYTPDRESAVLSRVLALNTGPLPARTVEAIYRELMSGSFRLEHPPRIGYLGPPGSYSHVAATRHFGSSVDFDDLHTIDGVFTEVSRGHVDYGLAPIENSIGGGVVETLDAFVEHREKVTVYAEVQLEVHHALLAACEPARVTTIYSKPEVFAQCRRWLGTQYPRAELVATASSAAAVQKVAHEVKAAAGVPGGAAAITSAAIGSVLAGERYGLVPLFENIEDRTGNVTRFFVLSRHKARPSGDDKTSMMFTTLDKPGALAGVLNVFDRAGINLTHIDKRPSGRSSWTYTFFIDAVGHIDDPWFGAAVMQAKGHCQELFVLGSYPRSVRIL